MFQSGWYQILELTLNLVGGVGGIVLATHYLMVFIRRKRRRYSFLGHTTEKYIAIGSSPEGATVRTPDSEALAELREVYRDKRLPSTCHARKAVGSNQIRSRPLMIFGSPRHNSLADEIQRRLDPPFQFVSLTPELSPKQSVLCIYDREGQQYTCSGDPSLGEIEQGVPPSHNGEEFDYGILLVGEINDEESSSQRIVWAAGIHGIGTLGVIKWVIENLDKYDWNELGNVCFLIRVAFSLPIGQSLDLRRDYEHIDNARPELLQGPYKWQPRHVQKLPLGILCDMGSVLLSFQRKRFYNNLYSTLGIQISDRQTREVENLRILFEQGKKTSAEFMDQLQQIVGVFENKDILEAAWCDIFWHHEREIAFLEKLHQEKKVKLILISNTDPLRLDYALNKLGLNMLFDKERIVTSYDTNVKPKGEDNSMLIKGLGILKREFQSEDFEVVFIDDVRTYLVLARQGGLGIHGIHYRNFSQLVCELRNYGLYIPISGSNV